MLFGAFFPNMMSLASFSFVAMSGLPPRSGWLICMSYVVSERERLRRAGVWIFVHKRFVVHSRSSAYNYQVSYVACLG